MPQSRLMLLIERRSGGGVTQLLVFPMFGLAATLGQNLAIGTIFTMISLARSYVLRRAFEAFRG